VDLARAALAYARRVLGRDVSDVGAKAVVREERVHAPHRPVADDLGHDRGSRDRRTALVAVDDRDMLRSAGPEAEAVDEARLRGRGQRMQSPTEPGEVRSMQPLAIDLRVRDDLDGDLRRRPEHGPEERLPVLRADLLRVVQLRQRANPVVAQRLVVEKDSCDDERSG